MKNLFYRIQLWLKHIRYPQNIWYGGSLKRSTALHSVGEGWSKFINNLYDAKPKKTRVTQVKEKWAGLRFYVECAPQWYEDLIIYYEQKSCETCEKCGKKGKARTDLGWMLTLCDKHYFETQNRINNTVCEN